MPDSPKKPKHVSYRSLFNKWNVRLLTLMFGLIYLWAFFFLPDSVIEWVASRIGVAKSVGGTIFTLFTSAVIVGTFGQFLIGDPLLRGDRTASRYFRGEFPSAKLANKFSIDPDRASHLFLTYYDCWQFDSEIQHDKYLETTWVHYWCLFVFLLKPLFWILLVLSASFIFVGMIYKEAPSSVIAGQITIFILIAICVVLIMGFNRLPSTQRPNPTGCWAAWRRRCGENYQEFLAGLGQQTLEDFEKVLRLKLQDLRQGS